MYEAAKTFVSSIGVFGAIAKELKHPKNYCLLFSAVKQLNSQRYILANIRSKRKQFYFLKSRRLETLTSSP